LCDQENERECLHFVDVVAINGCVEHAVTVTKSKLIR